MPRRTTPALAGAAVLMALAAAPALAHEEINPATVQTGKPTFFTLSAANEKQAPITKVVVKAPAGTALGEATRSPAGWTAQRTESSVTWTGGKVAPETFEQWGFEIEGADQPGTLTFAVALTAGGDSENVKVPVTVVAAGAGTTTTAAAATGRVGGEGLQALRAAHPLHHRLGRRPLAAGLRRPRQTRTQPGALHLLHRGRRRAATRRRHRDHHATDRSHPARQAAAPR